MPPRTLKTIGFKIQLKFKNCPHIFRTGPDFPSEKKARDMVEKLSEMDHVEEIGFSMNIEELMMSIEPEDKVDGDPILGFRSPDSQ